MSSCGSKKESSENFEALCWKEEGLGLLRERIEMVNRKRYTAYLESRALADDLSILSFELSMSSSIRNPPVLLL